MILTILFIVLLVLAVLAAPAAYPGYATSWPFGYGFLWLAVLCLGLKVLGAHVA